MAKISRTKGKVGELEVVDLLKEHGFRARRGVQYSGGGDSPDVIHDIAGVHVEVKRTEALSLYTAMEQAASDAGTKMPVLFHRRNGKPWLVVMTAPDFLSVMKEFEPGEYQDKTPEPKSETA